MTKTCEILKKFIVIEGLDGAGTTTQLKLLAKQFDRESLPCFATCEPTDGPIGRCIRALIKETEHAKPNTLALLFAADRNEHVFNPDTGILSKLEKGFTVISDRYLFSSLAYQSVECGYDYVFALNRDFPLPEQLLFIDIPVEVGLSRIEHRSTKEIFEKKSFLEAVHTQYKKILEQYSDSGMAIRVIDGTASPEHIHASLWEYIQAEKPC